jgi:hypothetical protein
MAKVMFPILEARYAAEMRSSGISPRCLCRNATATGWSAAAKNEGRADALNAASSPQRPSGEQIANFQEPSDPFEHFNEAMLIFNRKADDWVLRPTATGYAHVVPQPARASVGRFFENVAVIPRFANDLFQGQFKQGRRRNGAVWYKQHGRRGGPFRSRRQVVWPEAGAK